VLKLQTSRIAKDVDLGSLRYARIGGEMVFPSVVTAFETTYASAGLAQGALQPTYGMAETVVRISCGIPGEPWSVSEGAMSCGSVLPDMDLRVVDDATQEVAPGHRGYIHVRGPPVPKGYLELEPFEAGAWFDTGDVGLIKDDRVYIAGRVKNMIS